MGLDQKLLVAVAFDGDSARYWRNFLADAEKLAASVTFVDCTSTRQLISSAPDVIVGQPVPFLLDYLETRPAQLRWLHVMSSGVENIMERIGQAPGFAITNVKGVHREAMREFALAMMLHFAKNMAHWTEQKATRSWQPERLSLLSGASLLVVGAGSIGTAVAEICKVLGMEVAGLSRSQRLVPGFDRVAGLDQILAEAGRADYILSSLALTDQTRGIFDKDFFDAVKQGSIFINLSRGALVDEAALIAALEQGRLAGAALDAFFAEPLPAQSALWGFPNVFITPHIAGRFTSNHQRGRDHFLRNLQRFIANEPLQSQVNAALGY